ncbi:HK97 family phage prohead protease [Pseudoruegeria sp. SK021]|uniref:HK97 family phage prohead protease n=1 Tax=Pseudoruegeria sp. SK021 TaxID=1933035 RepID=UPI000A259179|nr:HK97 family phage prohead protease [Pseudoruegeria sp. SK021]OSP53823.1 hypothetical protein BV911_15770 [Pseudoruegeria sp. SK021]
MVETQTRRAHAVVKLRKASGQDRTIVGTASTPATDRQGDILDPLGAEFSLPFPLLLGHDHMQPIGEVIEARATSTGIRIKAQVAPEGTSARIDEAWGMIRAGLIKGLSVGFIGRDAVPLPGGGLRFRKWEVIEVSAVAVPANAEATITEVKRVSLNAPEAPRAAAGVPAYPRHLAVGERSAVLRMAVADHLDGIVKNTAQATGQPEAEVRAKHAGGVTEMLAELTVRMIWQEQRIRELEGRP